MSRIRPIVGLFLFLTALGTVGFLMYVSATSSVDTEPIFVIPLLLGALVGLILCIRVPDNNVGLVVSLATAALAGLGSSDVVRVWALDRDIEELAVVATLVGDSSWITLFVSVLVLLPIWFPDGLAPYWWSRWALGLAVGASLVALIAFWLAEEVCVVWPGDVCELYAPNPWGVAGNDGLWGEPFLLIPALMIVPAVVSAVVRRRRSTGIERQQLKWFGLALLLMGAGFVLSFELFAIPKVINDVVSSAALSGVWLSIGFAVLRYRLYEIDRIVSRTVTYALVVGLLVGAVAILAALAGTRSEDPLVVAATTLGVAALFNPLRVRIQKLVDRRFNRSRYDAERVMDGFARSLRDVIDPVAVVEGWTEVVADTMEPTVVGAWVSDNR